MQAQAAHAGFFASPKRTVDALPLEPRMRVADFGAGSGHVALELARQVPEGRVYAIDVQADLLRRLKNEAARAGLKNVELIHGDISRPHGAKLADASCDLVLLSNVLFQQEQPAAALREAWRVVRPGGMAALIEWSDSFRGMGPAKKHVITRERALQLAGENGFEALREFDAGAHHYGFILKPLPPARI